MRRREFITLLGGTAAWPVAARAQQGERMRRIGVLMAQAADDPEGQVRLAAFLRGLRELGWIEGHNIRLDDRWGGGNVGRVRKDAAELVALTPDVILAGGGQIMGPLHEATRTVPIVFTQTADSSRRRLRRQPVPAGRQCHRFYKLRIRRQREMA
jgi:putative tryptophan/tyrosine transport system substrate-binding protein